MKRGRPLLVLAGAACTCILHASHGGAEELCAAAAPEGSSAEGRAQVGAAIEAEPAGACPSDMAEVEGDFCPTVEQACLKKPALHTYRCLQYAPSRCVSQTTTHKHYCVDKYEWPNKKGEVPIVMKDWYEARDACRSVGKRLCTEDEWTLACEGPERLPYPYGRTRDSQACNIDKDHPVVDERALLDPKRRDAEVARLWQGEASGSRDRCVSPYGVYDMTGNVDEWAVNERGKPHSSALKGGYWSWVRGRCRAVTEGHEETFRFYQIGWRCCADAGSGAPATARAAAPPRAPASTSSAPASASAPAHAGAPAHSAAPAPASASASASAPASASASASAPPSARARGVAAAPGSASASASAPGATRTVPSPPPPPSTSEAGTIAIPARASAHRIFLDGKVLGPHRPVLKVPCGRHVVRLGRDGRDQDLDVPCGGRVSAAYP